MSRTYILLIEEQPEVLSSVEFLLKLRPQLTMVATVTNGAAGLHTAQVLRPDITLIDLQMDGFDSLETIRHLRALLPDMGIIAFSYGHQGIYREAALAAGADDFVAGTRITEDLLTVIHQVARVRQVRA